MQKIGVSNKQQQSSDSPKEYGFCSNSHVASAPIFKQIERKPIKGSVFNFLLVKGIFCEN